MLTFVSGLTPEFAYQHLAKRLTHLGLLECFEVAYVEPAYTSQTCPECGLVDSRNRSGDRFLCIACGFAEHADTVGGLNLNGGEAVLNYVGTVAGQNATCPHDYSPPEYPGLVCTPPMKQLTLAIGNKN